MLRRLLCWVRLRHEWSDLHQVCNAIDQNEVFLVWINCRRCGVEKTIWKAPPSRRAQ